jgi:DNA mismatch repair protein MSH5
MMNLKLLDGCDSVHSLTMVCFTSISFRPRLILAAVGDEPPLPYQVEIRPSQEFGYEGAKFKLINLETTIASNDDPRFLVPGDVSTYEDEQDHENLGSTNRQGKLLRLSSCIDLENRIGIGCMGVILTYLQRRRAANYLPEDPDAQRAFQVRSLEMFSLQDTM